MSNSMHNVIIMDRDDKYEMPTLLGIKILKYIKEYIRKNDIPPSRDEICRHVGHKNTGGITYAVNKLIKSGNIVKKGATRNLWPVENKE